MEVEPLPLLLGVVILIFVYVWDAVHQRPQLCPHCGSDTIHDFHYRGSDHFRCMGCGLIWRQP